MKILLAVMMLGLGELTLSPCVYGSEGNAVIVGGFCVKKVEGVLIIQDKKPLMDFEVFNLNYSGKRLAQIYIGNQPETEIDTERFKKWRMNSAGVRFTRKIKRNGSNYTGEFMAHDERVGGKGKFFQISFDEINRNQLDLLFEIANSLALCKK